MTEVAVISRSAEHMYMEGVNSAKEISGRLDISAPADIFTLNVSL
jgi:hypothetical protein